jgi:hypothetical protein
MTTLVDPPTPIDGSKLLIWDVDSMTSARLYEPNGSRDHPIYTLTSSLNANRITLERTSTGETIGVVDIFGKVKRARGRWGTVRVGVATDAQPLEQWLPMRGSETTQGKEARVRIGAREYTWAYVYEGEEHRKTAVFEVWIF